MTIRATGLLGLGMLAATVVQSPPDAAAILRAAREAIGGDAKLAAVRSLQLQGHTRNLIGSTGRLSDPRPLEIRILLPDHYLRTQNNGSHLVRAGFAGSELLNALEALRPGANFGASYGPEQIGTERVALVRLLLGMLADTAAVIPLKARRVSTETIELLGPDGFSAVLDLDKTSRLPARLRYTASVHFPEPGSRMPSTPQQAEVVWSFSEHRDVSGLQLPHRVLRTSRDITLQETGFDTIRVNPQFTPKDFKD